MKKLENTLTNWSYKKLKMYRACPYSVYLKYVLRLPAPPPNPKFEEKRQRGIIFHDTMELVINEGAPLPKLAEPFEEIVCNYIEIGATAEQDEFFDNRWRPHQGWEGHWLIVKKDVRAVVPGEYVLVADWKTGKKHGNELDHFEQMKLYAVSEYVKDPGYPEYAVELQYVDQLDTWAHSFKPRELEKAWADFDKDVAVMMNDTTFRPKPSVYTCRYCDYNKKNGTGECPVAAV